MRKFTTNLIALLFVSVTWAQAEPTTREMQMLDEINYVRTNPQEYVQYIQEYLDFWDSEKSERAAAKELTKRLNKMRPLDSLVFSNEMYQAAVKHGEWMKRTRKFEHSDLEYAENIVAGDDQIRFAVLSLLIDDGIPSRGHRENILEPSYTEFAAREVPGKVGEDEFVFIQEFR